MTVVRSSGVGSAPRMGANRVTDLGPIQAIGPPTWSREARSSMSENREGQKVKQPVRPRDLALLLLASADLRPRKRARDQQADAAGLQLKRRLMDHLAALDPEPEDLERCLT